jgi:addiction module HigA family antidote
MRTRSKSLTTIKETVSRVEKRLAPIHPGEILREEFLEPLEMNMKALAEAIHVPPNRVGQIVAGGRSITAETALRFARFFGTTPEFWLNLQQRYDLNVARDHYGRQIEREIQRNSHSA